MIFSKRNKKRIRLMTVNSKEIQECNARMLPRLIWVAILLVCIPIILSIFDADIRQRLPGYGLALLVCILLAVVFNSKKMKKYSLLGMYLLFLTIYCLVLYLSLICFPQRHASTVLSFFCVMPLLFIDRHSRIDTVVVVLYLIHTGLSYYIKGPIIGRIDAINCLVSAFLGITAGDAVLASQLSSIEAHRQLTLEKETDVLTGLKNRRKLFETIERIDTSEKRRATGVLMLDIDHFKEVNDANGHAVGDSCLSSFGAMLGDFERLYNINFYRYGGEEFVGLAYVNNEQELLTLAESIRLATSQKPFGSVSVTVSIGEVWCGEQTCTSLEQWVERADKAVYEAKSSGRNSLFQYLVENDTTIPYIA